MSNDTLERASTFAFKRLERVGGDPRKLSDPLKTLVIVYSAQGIIDNGGFGYFFGSDYPGKPPYSIFVEAYRTIGAEEAADAIERAMNLFPFKNPHRAVRRRRTFMQSQPESGEFFALGDSVCGSKVVWERLEHYVSRHKAAFWAA